MHMRAALSEKELGITCWCRRCHSENLSNDCCNIWHGCLVCKVGKAFLLEDCIDFGMGIFLDLRVCKHLVEKGAHYAQSLDGNVRKSELRM